VLQADGNGDILFMPTVKNKRDTL